MPIHRFTTLIALVILATVCPAPAVANATRASVVNMQKPPNYEAAIRSEFESVQAENTVEAYERFIRRHPDHPLVDEARKALLRLRKQ